MPNSIIKSFEVSKYSSKLIVSITLETESILPAFPLPGIASGVRFEFHREIFECVTFGQKVTVKMLVRIQYSRLKFDLN